MTRLELDKKGSQRMKGSRDSLFGRWVKVGAAVAALVGAAGLTAGCLDRPVAKAIPQTSNVFVDQIRQTAINKIDLLFVIDNSISMADKQEILTAAVPQLLNRLITPNCVDADGNVVGVANEAGDCTAGAPEFDPVDDIHIGIVTSSLGAHGGQICSPNGPQFNATQNDAGRLLPSVRTGLTSTNGFLVWDGVSDKDTLIQNFQDHVVAAGENGCGFEATLESWYRFLVDPEPPAEIVLDGDQAVAQGIDQTVLDQRAQFLRPDSLVAIIMLTDENDCSVQDSGVGWLTTMTSTNNQQFRMFSATQACETNPNDPCCRSCGIAEGSPPSGCAALDADPGCTPRNLEPIEDELNLRCYNQKQRFGWDLLYDTDRYVAGLTQLSVMNRAGDAVPNPLFQGGGGAATRDPALVFLAGIVGVPWQDIATEDSLSGAGLTYLTAEELIAEGRWSVILGNPDQYIPPTDPLMVETPFPRSGTNPITGDAIAGTDATSPTANPINGHEYSNPEVDDLQYACIFPLAAARDCSVDEGGCDCTAEETSKNKPLCNPPAGGAAGTTQYFAKAYPGTRHLQVLRDFGLNSIVASICPKVASGSGTDPNFGYNPAVSAIIDRLKEVLGGRCLPRELVSDPETGQVPCALVEAIPPGGDTTACESVPGRGPVNEKIDPAVRQQLADTGVCGGVSEVDCNGFHLCEILQLAGGDLNACRTQPDESVAGLTGYCYVDPSQAEQGVRPQVEALVEDCPATQRRKLRFLGDETPRNGSITFVACVGASFSQVDDDATDGS